MNVTNAYNFSENLLHRNFAIKTVQRIKLRNEEKDSTVHLLLSNVFYKECIVIKLCYYVQKG